jgi:SAM-dependent methyltransferase
MARPRYGVDAPWVLVGLFSGAAVLLAGATAAAAGGLGPSAVVGSSVAVGRSATLGMLFGGLFFLASAFLFLHTTLRGKFLVWGELLDELGLAGDERLLDVGCGRGAVLLAAARRLPRGRAVGVDLWRSVDQSGNSADGTRRNAVAEGVADRVELHTGDMTQLPFDDGSFDVVLSSMAIHNLDTDDGRRRAVEEAFRVLRPGGQLVVADIGPAAKYAGWLGGLGAADVVQRPLGWRFWYGGPWVAARLVTAARRA